jgi:hypothetical protein
VNNRAQSGSNPEDNRMTDPRPCPNNMMHAREQVALRADKIISECEEMLKTDVPALTKIKVYEIIRHTIEVQRQLREMGEPLLPPDVGGKPL